MQSHFFYVDDLIVLNKHFVEIARTMSRVKFLNYVLKNMPNLYTLIDVPIPLYLFIVPLLFLYRNFHVHAPILFVRTLNYLKSLDIFTLQGRLGCLD